MRCRLAGPDSDRRSCVLDFCGVRLEFFERRREARGGGEGSSAALVHLGFALGSADAVDELSDASPQPVTGCSSRRTAPASSAATKASSSTPTETGQAHRLISSAMLERGRRRSRILSWRCSWLRSWSASSSSKRWSGCSPSARAGSGGAVVFEGPAGIGKSSLLAAARTAAAADFRVLSARGGELERELPFGIVRQLLEPVVATDAEEREAPAGRGGSAGQARPLCVRSGNRGRGVVLGLARALLADVNLAGSQPVLVTVDDAHWADVASLRWLIYLARRLAGVPLALVLATRPAEPGPVQELHDDLLVIPEVAVLRAGRAERGGDHAARGAVAVRGTRPGIRHRLPAGDRRQPVPAPGALRRARRAAESRRVARTPVWPAS